MATVLSSSSHEETVLLAMTLHSVTIECQTGEHVAKRADKRADRVEDLLGLAFLKTLVLLACLQRDTAQPIALAASLVRIAQSPDADVQPR